MVAADQAIAVDQPWRAAEFTGGDDHHAFGQPAVVDIFDQGRNALIHERRAVRMASAMSQRVIGVDVIVPTEVAIAERRGQGVDRDHGHTRLGQAAREQAALPPQVPAIPVAHLDRLRG